MIRLPGEICISKSLLAPSRLKGTFSSSGVFQLIHCLRFYLKDYCEGLNDPFYELGHFKALI